MSTSEIIILSLMLLFSIVSFVIAYFQLNGKGFLFHNSYIYASKEERNRMNKKPYYRQSAIAFGTMGLIFFVLAAAIFTDWDWLFPLVLGLSIFLIVYAIVSSYYLERKRK
jgi:hypothetical protein